jgi:transglutaminase-like putative cysteine protease
MPETAANSLNPTRDASPSAATLAPTTLIDSDHPAVRAFAAAHAKGADDRARAVALYGAVRDGFRYDPYRADLSPAGMTASTVLAQGFGWCVPKATLLTAACRAAGMPARLGFADVRNHLSTERMRSSMETEIFYWHGYTEIWIEGGWRKATPAFNLSLCQKFGLLPLDFDGLTDSIYHPFDAAGNRHMDYVAQRGSFDDLPLDQILVDFRQHYPKWLANMAQQHSADFMAEVEQEAAARPLATALVPAVKPA